MTDHLEQALALADFGWLVFPVHSMLPDGTCDCTPPGEACSRGNPGKHPWTRNGLLDASNEPGQIRAWWTKWPEANVGVRTGCGIEDGSDLWVLDIDPKHGGEISLAELEAEFGEIHCPNKVRTGSGGWHLYFVADDEERRRSGTDLRPGVDWRCDGGYVIAPPSLHHSGARYEWYEGGGQYLTRAPGWLTCLIDERARPVEATGEFQAPTEETIDPALLAELQSALLFIPSENRDTWLRVGMGLKRAGEDAEAPEAFFRLWCWWSQQSGKFDPQDSRRVWRSIDDRGADSVTQAAIFGMAQDCGWSNPAAGRPDPAPPVQCPPEELRVLPPLRGEPMPPRLLEVDGLLGELCAWINSSTPVQQPVATLAASLVALGALYGRRYRSPSDVRTNLYGVILGQSGAGKDGARSRLAKLFREAGMGKWLGGQDWASGQGILASLREHPVRLFMVDEFGDTLASATSQRSGPHLRAILQNLKVLYTSANADLEPSEYASKERREAEVTLRQPHLCVLGTSTPEPFFQALTRRQLEDGLGNRFLVFPLQGSGELNPFDRISTTPPAPLVQLLKSHEEAGRPQGGNIALATGDGPARTVPFTEAATERWADFRAQVHRMEDQELHEGVIAPLWQRVPEIAMKLAMIRALSRTTASPVVEEWDMSWALELAIWSVRCLEGYMAHHLADTPFENNVHRVRRLLAQNGTMTHSEVMRTTRLSTAQMKDVVSFLVAANEMAVETEQTGGRPKTIYSVRLSE